MEFLENWSAQSSTKEEKKTLLETKEVGPEQQIELTHFNDAEEEITVMPVLSYTQMHAKIDNPFPRQVPSHILKRNYLVAELLWTGPLVTYNVVFPEVLFAENSIQDALSSFLYFRAGVKIEIRMNSTPYHMGAIIVCWKPCTSDLSPSLYTASGLRPITLSASTQQACTFTIPYLSPKTWIRLDSFDTAEIATVSLVSLAPLITTSADVSPDVHIQVYASFVEPEVAGYVPGSTLRMRTKPRDVVEPQSKIISADGSMHDPVNKEAQNKTRTGTTTVPSLGYFIRPILRCIPIIGGFIDPIIDVFKVIFGIMDKPTGVPTITPVSMDLTRDMSQASGLDNSQTLSLYPTPAIPFVHELMGGESSAMSFTQLACVPMLHKFYILDLAQTQFSIHCIPEAVDNPEGMPDFLFVAAECHQWWRGSFRYYFQFFTTAFTSCRVRISLNYINWTSDVTTSGDIVSKIVDIKGDTNVSITVPYLSETHWRRRNISDTFPVLVTELITPIIGQSVSADSTIYVAVWRSAAPDFQFCLPTNVPVAGFDVVEPQCDIRSTFKQSFDPILDGCTSSVEKGFVQCEVSGTINDVLKRYVGNVDSSTTFPTPLQPLPGTGTYSTWGWLSQVWYFWRGSRRMKHFFAASSPDICVVRPTTDVLGIGSSGRNATVPDFYPLVGTEIPWFHNMPYAFNFPSTAAITTDDPVGILVNGTLITSQFFISAGDDFTLGFLIPPAPLPALASRNPFRTRKRTKKARNTPLVKSTTTQSLKDLLHT